LILAEEAIGQGWVGGAVVGGIIAVGGMLVQWWLRVRQQKSDEKKQDHAMVLETQKTRHDTQVSDLREVVDYYKDLLKTKDTLITDLGGKFDRLTLEHTECNKTMTEYKVRLELNEKRGEERDKMILLLQEKVVALEARLK
jgi:hypothetical protein